MKKKSLKAKHKKMQHYSQQGCYGSGKANETLAVEQKMIETLRQKVHALEQALKKAETQSLNMALKRDSDEYE